MNQSLVAGPIWIDAAVRDYGGLYPLAVERHVLDQVARLVPGVTTVTPHARYYTLHGLVAATAERDELTATETYALARRCEVVIAAVSLAHHYNAPGAPGAHGANTIYPIVSQGEPLDIDLLSRPGGYAKAKSGFWGPYMASESTMGLIDWSSGVCRAGEHLDVDRVRSGLEEVVALASRSQLSHDEAVDHEHLCLCRAAGAPDGDAFLERLVPKAPPSGSAADRRQQTIKLVLRLLTLNPGVDSIETDLPEAMLFGDAERSDAILRGLDAREAWGGVALRSLQVTAWRDLWQYIGHSMVGIMSVGDLGSAVADALPAQSLKAYVDDLPDVTTSDPSVLLPAEEQVRDRERADQLLATILLGVRRQALLPPRMAAYYENTSESRERLSPTWVSEQTSRWQDRSVRDFAAYVTGQMVQRSQQIALSKSTLNIDTGSLRIPTRVYVRDGYIYNSGVDAGGPVALRWNTLVSLMTGLGLTQFTDDGWVVTARGEGVCQNS